MKTATTRRDELELQLRAAADAASQPTEKRRDECNHAGDITGRSRKSLEVSDLFGISGRMPKTDSQTVSIGYSHFVSNTYEPACKRLCLLKIPKASKSLAILLGGPNVAGMLALISTLFSWLACRVRSRADLELELIALRHQVAVLKRQRPGRLRLCSVDRLVWVWLYRVWPRCLETIF